MTKKSTAILIVVPVKLILIKSLISNYKPLYYCLSTAV